MTPLVEVTGLVVSRVRDGAPVVDEVSFTVVEGEVVGVVGESGSGKTTTALALLGHLRPGLRRTSGLVRVGGVDPFDPARVAGLRRRVVAFLGQDPAAELNPARRIGSQLGEAVRTRGGVTGRAAVGAEVARLLTRVGLPSDRGFLRRYPHEVSGGQARRVAFGIATAGTPRLLVLDEPTASLDRAAADEVRALIAERPNGCATLLVSHDPATITATADRVLAFDRGRIVPRPPVSAIRPRTVRAPEGGALLAATGLHAHHGETQVLADVDLRVHAGRCVAVVGPSGSGKSTLARCLVGLHAPGAGEIRLAGAALVGAAAKRAIEQRRAVQLVAQDSAGALNPRETVIDAVTRPMRGLDAAAARARAIGLLARVRLPADVAGRRPGSLSGGERQRVNLARALACEPRVVVCDEITSALDAATTAAVLDLVAELCRGTGLGVVLVTHDLAEVARYADDVVMLADGRVRAAGPVDEVLTEPVARPVAMGEHSGPT